MYENVCKSVWDNKDSEVTRAEEETWGKWKTEKRRENALEHPLLKGFSTGRSVGEEALTNGDPLWPPVARRGMTPRIRTTRGSRWRLHRHPLHNPSFFKRSAIFGTLMHHVAPPLLRQTLKCHDTLSQTNTHQLWRNHSVHWYFRALLISTETLALFRLHWATRRNKTNPQPENAAH